MALGNILITAVPTPGGIVSSKYRDGDDSLATPPSTPEISQPVAVSDTEFDVPLLTASTGGTAPLAYELSLSSTDAVSGFSVHDAAADFAGDGVYNGTGLTAETQYWARLACVDDDGRRSGYSTVYSFTTQAAGGGDATAPTTPTSLLATSTVTGVAEVSWVNGTDAVGVVYTDILRGDGDGAGNPVVSGSVIQTLTGSPPAQTYHDAAAPAGDEVYYRIRHRDAAGNIGDYTNRYFVTVADTIGGTVLAGSSFEEFGVYAGSQNGGGVVASFPKSSDADYTGYLPLAFGCGARGSYYGAWNYGSRPTIVSSPVYRGSRAFRANIPVNAATNLTYRSEVEFQPWGVVNTANYEGVTQYIGWAMYLDPAFPLNDSTVFAQNHSYSGQPGGSPNTYGLRIQNGDYRLTSETNPGIGEAGTTYSATIQSGGVSGDRGVWRRWVLEIKLSSLGVGWIKVYKDGTLIHTTPNYNTVAPGTTQSPYTKFGLYPGSGAVAAAMGAVYDSWRFSDSNSGGSVALVDPGNY